MLVEKDLAYLSPSKNASKEDKKYTINVIKVEDVDKST